MEINCCGIALAAIIVNLISLLLFFGYSIKVNKGNNAFSFSGGKETLPVNFKEFQTNYNKKAEEEDNKFSLLEKKIEELEGIIKKTEKK